MKKWLLVAFILVVTFLFFSPVLKNDFVNWDDDVNVIQNPNVRELNAASIKDMFSHTVISAYTPLTTLSFAVENKLFGMKPGVFHLNNLLLHLLCTLLVFIFLRKLGSNLFVTFAATILFGIHPMRVESVAWITERKDVLYSFFYLLSLISYITYYKNKRPAFYFLALAAFVFSLMSKIQAVSLPLLLLLIDYFFGKKFRFKQALDKIPFFLLALITGVVGISILWREGSLETNTVLPLIQRVFIGAYTLCVYLIKAVFPYQMSAIYPIPAKLTLLFYASALLVILLAFLIYKSGRHRKTLIFGSLFFLFNVIFMLQIVGAGQAFLADRFTYLAYIGLFYLIAWALNFLYISKWKTYVIFSGLIYLAVLGTATWKRTQVWKNSETLFSDVIRKYPKATFAYNNLGVYYRDQNQDDKAIAAYGKSIEINPEGYVSYNNRGEVYFGRGEIDKAIKDMNIAIKLKPDYIKALSNRGAAWGSKNQFVLALDDLNKAISLDPKLLSGYLNRSLVYYAQGSYEKAVRDIASYVLVKPDNADIFNLRALCFSRLNKNQEALADFTKSIQLNPKAGAYFQNRSSLLYKMGDFKGALKITHFV
jgi:tetratricopeptide (TPR) repeat protein